MEFVNMYPASDYNQSTYPRRVYNGMHSAVDMVVRNATAELKAAGMWVRGVLGLDWVGCTGGGSGVRASSLGTRVPLTAAHGVERGSAVIVPAAADSFRRRGGGVQNNTVLVLSGDNGGM